MNGKLPLIIPSVRAIIRDDDGNVLFIERKKGNLNKTNEWGMPAGSIELGESIYECLCREVKEETGLVVEEATLVSIYTGVKGLGEKGQLFEFCFRVNRWTGDLLTETGESTDARFFPRHQLPRASSEFWHHHHIDVLHDLEAFSGHVILK